MADMSELMKNFSTMIENGQIPDNIKDAMKSIQNNSNNNNNENKNQTSPKENNSSSNIDIETFLKFQKIINKINSSPDSSGACLLRSLKPYLNEKRQGKIEEYIKLLNIEKYIAIFQEFGGDKNIGL